MILDNVSLLSEHKMLGRAKIGRGSLEKEAVMWKVILTPLTSRIQDAKNGGQKYFLNRGSSWIQGAICNTVNIKKMLPNYAYYFLVISFPLQPILRFFEMIITYDTTT